MGFKLGSKETGRWERQPATSRRRHRLLPVSCGLIVCISCAESWLTSQFLSNDPPHVLKRRERFCERQPYVIVGSSGRSRNLALSAAPAAPAIEMVSTRGNTIGCVGWVTTTRGAAMRHHVHRTPQVAVLPLSHLSRERV